MTWNYDATQMLNPDAGGYPGSTVGMRMQIRYVIQDTNSSRQLMDDFELDFLQSTEANQYMAAALACEILVARAGNVKEKHVGPLSTLYDPEFYAGLAATLRARGLFHQVPYAGGISIADKLSQENNPDWVPTRVFRGFLDNPNANQPAAGSEPQQTGPNAPGSFA